VRLFTATLVVFAALFSFCPQVAGAHQPSKSTTEKCESCIRATASHYVSKAAAEKYAKKSKVDGLCGRGAVWDCDEGSIKIRCISRAAYHSWLCNASWTELSTDGGFLAPPTSWQKWKGRVQIIHAESAKDVSMKPIE
jgi:hypothetical protein